MVPTTVLAIGIGGFAGAIARFVVSQRIALWLGTTFPFGTLAVNAAGSFLLGFLSRFFLEHLIVEEALRVGILVGFLGAFTTFSTFSYETVVLIQEGELLKFLANILANSLICITLCFFGLQLAKLV